MKRLLAILSAGVLLIAVPGAVSGADEVFSGPLRGSNEVPRVTTNASGTAYVFINEAETEVKYAVSYTGLSGPLIAAHVHVGAAGSNGPIALPLADRAQHDVRDADPVELPVQRRGHDLG